MPPPCPDVQAARFRPGRGGSGRRNGARAAGAPSRHRGGTDQGRVDRMFVERIAAWQLPFIAFIGRVALTVITIAGKLYRRRFDAVATEPSRNAEALRHDCVRRSWNMHRPLPRARVAAQTEPSNLMSAGIGARPLPRGKAATALSTNLRSGGGPMFGTILPYDSAASAIDCDFATARSQPRCMGGLPHSARLGRYFCGCRRVVPNFPIVHSWAQDLVFHSDLAPIA
jgi:hypothetical protein